MTYSVSFPNGQCAVKNVFSSGSFHIKAALAFASKSTAHLEIIS